MDKLTQRFTSAKKALATLEAIIEEPFTIIVRDAAIQRFEYTFESMWKLTKLYLQELEGLLCNSPKRCWRELFATGIITEEEGARLLTMTDDRNLTSHTYVEGVAQEIYQNLPQHWQLLQTVYERLALKASSTRAGEMA